MSLPDCPLHGPELVFPPSLFFWMCCCVLSLYVKHRVLWSVHVYLVLVWQKKQYFLIIYTYLKLDLFNVVYVHNVMMLEGSGIDVRMMCGVAQTVLPPCAQLSIALSHTCTPHPSCCPPFTVSSVMCPHRRESVLFFLSIVIVQLSESTTTLCSLPPIILPMYIPMTLPSLTFLQQ